MLKAIVKSVDKAAAKLHKLWQEVLVDAKKLGCTAAGEVIAAVEPALFGSYIVGDPDIYAAIALFCEGAPGNVVGGIAGEVRRRSCRSNRRGGKFAIVLHLLRRNLTSVLSGRCTRYGCFLWVFRLWCRAVASSLTRVLWFC